MNELNSVVEASGALADVVTGDMMGGVLDELVSLLPIVIPVLIGFIGLRKGIAFVRSILHSA